MFGDVFKISENLLYQDQIKQIQLEMSSSVDEINSLEIELVKLQDKKHSFKRKEDIPALEKCVAEEKHVLYKIDYLKNNISNLKNKLEKIHLEEKRALKTRQQMDGYLRYMELGENRVQASKSSAISLSKVHKWYGDGKANKNPDSAYFYNQVNFYETFYQDFPSIFKREFERKNKVHLLKSFVPPSYPQRLDRFFNDDSKLWYAYLELRDQKSLHYFGLKDEIVPRLTLVFDTTISKSNFRLFDGKLHVLLRFTKLKSMELDVIPLKEESNQYYVSLGKLDSGELHKKMEYIITGYMDYLSNPINLREFF